jgi:hypothetical protein
MIAANLFDAIGVAPSLPGARCRGRHATFDGAEPGEEPAVVAQRHRQALALCSACLSLDRCQAWLNGLPKSKRPAGVVAGQVWWNCKPKSERQPGRPRKGIDS